MAVRQIFVPATPRSEVFKYYQTIKGSSVSTINSGGIIGGNTNDTGSFDTLNIIGTGNVVTDIAVNAEDDTVLDVTKGNVSGGGISFVGDGGDIVTDMSYDAASATLTETKSNLTDMFSINTALDKFSHTLLITNIALNYRNPGTVIGVTYKQLVAGTGISVTADENGNIIIENTGGGSGSGGLQSNANNNYVGLQVVPAQTLAAYANSHVALIPTSDIGFSPFLAMASVMYSNQSVNEPALSCYTKLNTLGIDLYIQNNNSSPVTIAPSAVMINYSIYD